MVGMMARDGNDGSGRQGEVMMKHRHAMCVVVVAAACVLLEKG